MSNFKPLHDKWIVQAYEYLKKEIEAKDQGKVRIAKVEKCANKIYIKSESSSNDKRTKWYDKGKDRVEVQALVSKIAALSFLASRQRKFVIFLDPERTKGSR